MDMLLEGLESLCTRHKVLRERVELTRAATEQYEEGMSRNMTNYLHQSPHNLSMFCLRGLKRCATLCKLPCAIL